MNRYKYAAFLKTLSIRQDIQAVKDSAKELADNLKLPDGNTIRALLDYINVIEGDIENLIREADEERSIAINFCECGQIKHVGYDKCADCEGI